MVVVDVVDEPVGMVLGVLEVLGSVLEGFAPRMDAFAEAPNPTR